MSSIFEKDPNASWVYYFFVFTVIIITVSLLVTLALAIGFVWTIANWQGMAQL